jgi:ASC-1-like (ASCH) protein
MLFTTTIMGKTVKDRVYNLLLNDTENKYRDDDQRLVARIIWECIEDKNMSAQQMLHNMFIAKIYPKPKSIERCSRALQNEYPGLRGKKWVDRQIKSEEIRTNINKAFEL